MTILKGLFIFIFMMMLSQFLFLFYLLFEYRDREKKITIIKNEEPIISNLLNMIGHFANQTDSYMYKV